MAQAEGQSTADLEAELLARRRAQAGEEITEGADPSKYGLPAKPTMYGVGVVPDAKLVILTLGTPNGPLSFSLGIEQLEGTGTPDDEGMIDGLQQGLSQAKTGLVKASQVPSQLVTPGGQTPGH